MKIKYSIVIPTRNSTTYLKSQLSILLKSKRDDFEILISDNNDSCDNELNAYLSDNRVKIIWPDFVLSMSSNYEFAINHVSGEWVQLLGSDDAILPWYFEKLDYLLHTYKDIRVITWRRAYFFWPDSPSVYDGRCLEFSANMQIKVCNIKSHFFFALIGLKSMFELPQLYTGSLIKKDLIDEIKMKSNGLFYHSIIPDIYSSVAIMTHVKDYVYSNLPMTLIGTSGKTMGFLNRIYQDSNELNYFDSKSPRKIHSSISETFHSTGFSSFYLLEGFRSAPFSKSTFKGHCYTIAAYLDVLNTNKIRNGLNKVIRPLIQQMRIDEFFKIWYIYFLIILLPFLKVSRLFYMNFYIPLIFKLNGGLRRSKKLLKVESKDREKFNNIEVAAFAISDQLH